MNDINQDISTNNQDQDSTTELENDMNNISLVNRIYREYVKNPKGLEAGMEEIDLEIMLINSLQINAGKIQEIVDSFLIEKEYTSIFCLTETKVDYVDFVPIGLTTYDRQRSGRP